MPMMPHSIRITPTIIYKMQQNRLTFLIPIFKDDNSSFIFLLFFLFLCHTFIYLPHSVAGIYLYLENLSDRNSLHRPQIQRYHYTE